MSKVICDVCGTAYAETANQCPICGTAKTEDTRPTDGSTTESGYAYVRGGRFSQSNVRKHNKGKQELPRTVDERKPTRTEESEENSRITAEEAVQERTPRRSPRKPNREEPENAQPSNIGLIIVVVALLLVIISLCAYIAIRYINMNNAKKASEGSTTAPSTSDIVDVPCTGISILGVKEHTFTSLSDELWLEVERTPANTTDLVSWEYDDTIVHVERIGDQWVITPVGIGETEITVSCGDHSDTMTVFCNLTNIPCNGITIDGPDSHTFTTTEPLRLTVTCNPASTTEEVIWDYDETVVSVTQDGEQWVITPVDSGSTTVTVTCGEYSDSISIVSNINLEPGFVLEWSCDSDITLTGYGTKWRIYNGSVPAAQIVFSSSDESIATVENGYVYIWKNGDVTITAAYGDQVITMIVRARKVEEPDEGTPKCTIHTNYGTSGNEFTIYVGDALRLELRDENGVKLEDVTFSVENEEYLTIDENGKITIVAPNRNGTYVYIEWQGYVYKCLVRVYERTI